MRIELIFDGIIDLPQSQYFFTLRVTFWQALLSFLSVFLVAIDTAINDLIERGIEKIKEKFNEITWGLRELFLPRMACA